MSVDDITCHHCGASLAIAPVFANHHGRKYQALAICSFDGGESGKRRLRRSERGYAGGCRILFGREEFPNPTRAAKSIVRYQVNGWRFWKYESGGRVMSLSELAEGL